MPDTPASDQAVTAAAGALMTQYGEDAVVIATLHAADSAARGDSEVSDHWVAVAALIEAMSGS